MGVKINDTTEFPTTTPAATDRVLGIDVSNTTNDANGEVVTFTAQAIADLATYTVTEADVTQHEAALTITESQISDLGTYLTSVTGSNVVDMADWPAGLDVTELSYVNGVTSAIQTQLDAKAPLASPALTGNPTAPTQTASDNSTKIATTAYVDAAAGGGLVPISKTTASSDAAIDIDLTGGYNAYMVRFSNVRVANDDVDMYIRTSTDGGTSFDAGAGNYEYNYYWLTPTDSNSSSTSETFIILAPQLGNAAGEYLDGYLMIYPANGSRNTRVQGHLIYDQKDSITAGTWSIGMRLDTTAVDAVRFLMQSGNITSGDFHLYGVADGA